MSVEGSVGPQGGERPHRLEITALESPAEDLASHQSASPSQAPLFLREVLDGGQEEAGVAVCCLERRLDLWRGRKDT